MNTIEVCKKIPSLFSTFDIEFHAGEPIQRRLSVMHNISFITWVITQGEIPHSPIEILLPLIEIEPKLEHYVFAFDKIATL